MNICRAVLLLLVLATAGRSVASDTPYGAGSIPFLVDSSTKIVRVEAGTEIVRSAVATTYLLTIAETLRGVPEPELVVAIPSEVGTTVVVPPPGSLLFLTRVLTDDEKVEWEIGDSRAVFAVAAGMRGVLTPAAADEAAVHTYLNAETPEEREEWARAQLTSGSAYLQRSAVLAAAGVGAVRFEDATEAQFLREAVNLESVETPIRQTALQAYVAEGAPGASEVLRDLATDPDVPDALRQDAIIALPRVDGGLEVLEDLSTSNDAFISGTARQRGRLDDWNSSVKLPSPRRLQADEVESSVARLLEGGQPLTEQLQILTEISQSRSALAADALQRVIVSSEKPVLRNAAFGKLFALDPSQRREVLKVVLQDSDVGKQLKARAREQLHVMGERE